MKSLTLIGFHELYPQVWKLFILWFLLLSYDVSVLQNLHLVCPWLNLLDLIHLSTNECSYLDHLRSRELIDQELQPFVLHVFSEYFLTLFAIVVLSLVRICWVLRFTVTSERHQGLQSHSSQAKSSCFQLLDVPSKALLLG